MKMTRRKWIVATGLVGGGLAVGFSLSRKEPVPPPSHASALRPHAWLEITPDNRIVFQVVKGEMGQGVIAGLPTVIAEELDVAPDKLEVHLADLSPEWASDSMTAGSFSMTRTWQTLREAGAVTRWLFVHAAAEMWAVDARELVTEDAHVVHSARGLRATYGSLIARAKKLEPPDTVPLKAVRDFRWIGKEGARPDALAKVTGKAEYGLDVRLPDMLVAVVLQAPSFSGRIRGIDERAIRAERGVVDVFVIDDDRTVAIVADGYWNARCAADRAEIDWDAGPMASVTSASIAEEQQRILAGELDEVVDEGDYEDELPLTTLVIKARYATPFHAHLTMEPQNATAWVRHGKVDVWLGSQAPSAVQNTVAQVLGLAREEVHVHPRTMGGGFGRRVYADVAVQAALISARVGKPVKVVWSREDDVKHDFYRGPTTHALEAGLDEHGNIRALRHDFVAPSTYLSLLPYFLGARVATAAGPTIGALVGSAARGLVEDSSLDPTTLSGSEPLYAIPHRQVRYGYHTQGVRVGFWRSVGLSYNIFAVETFIDELAHAAKRDPYEFRRAHLAAHPRLQRVLDLAAKASAWGKPAPGRYQGIAIADSSTHGSVIKMRSSVVATVAELSIGADKSVRVHRVVQAIDCGQVVTPDIVRAQMEGSVSWAMSAALKPQITISRGAVEQSNFHDAPVVRMNECPEIEVHFVHSEEPPTGVGEPGVPPVFPALGNAIFAATGQRLRNLPLRLT